MENTTHLFLAMRFNCNKCHDHPFERWTQDQYYRLAAFFARVGFKTDPASGDKKIGGTAVEGGQAAVRNGLTTKPEGEVTHLRTGKVDAARSFPSSAITSATRRRHAPRAAGRVDHVARQSLLRQELRQSPVGLPDRPRI